MVLIVIARGEVVQIADFDAVTEFLLYRKHRGSDPFETLMWEYAENAGILRGRR